MVEKLMNVEETAGILGVSVHTVYSWVSSGRLPLVKVGARTMFDQGEIRRWVVERSRREAGGAGPQPESRTAVPMPAGSGRSTDQEPAAEGE